MVKNLPAMQATWVRSLGWEDPLEKGMATHSIILAWRIPWTEEPGGLQSQRVRHDWVTHTHTHTGISWGSCVPLSCWAFLMRKGRGVENEMNPMQAVKKEGWSRICLQGQIRLWWECPTAPKLSYTVALGVPHLFWALVIYQAPCTYFNF